VANRWNFKLQNRDGFEGGAEGEKGRPEDDQVPWRPKARQWEQTASMISDWMKFLL
jgi:hypothetical protein